MEMNFLIKNSYISTIHPATPASPLHPPPPHPRLSIKDVLALTWKAAQVGD